MLWLECDSYHANISSIPESDYTDQEILIFKKFFRPESNFSLIHLIPHNLRHLILTALSVMKLDGPSSVMTNHYSSPQPSNSLFASNTHDNSTNAAIMNGIRISTKAINAQLLQDAQRWVEDDISNGSFLQFLKSDTCSCMIGYLRYSPPFVKMSLMDILRCDCKSMYLMVFLCQIKRYVAIGVCMC